MPDFDANMNQLLAVLAHLAPGRRERLRRPIRQHDLECWPDDTGEEATNALKAAMRVAVHELIDQFCFGLEAVLTRCDHDETRVLVAALSAVAMADGVRVRFRDDQKSVDTNAPVCELLTIEPISGAELHIEWASLDDGTRVRKTVSAGSTTPDADPFAYARRLIDGLRAKSGSPGGTSTR